MDWTQLLNAARVKDLYRAGDSVKSPADFRGEFERDYGRTVFSTPLRRLQDKAQVFPLVTSDFVRTRLTHSIEVSSVARGLAASVGRWLLQDKKISIEQSAGIETIAATCGMLHDLGNPPFGHAGEQAISQWCEESLKVEELFSSKPQFASDFVGWNGNAQTIRLIGKLQVLADEYGLNLTAATMSATCKYVASSDAVDSEHTDASKVGYFYSETDLIDKIRAATGTGQARHPIAILVEACDDIVYACVDLEDGIKKRLITWDTLEKELIEGAGECTHTKEALRLAKIKIGSSLTGFARDEGMVQAFRTYAIIEATKAAFEEFQKAYPSIMDGKYRKSLVKESSAKSLIKMCKIIARRVCYESEEVYRNELMGRRIIQDLLSIFWQGVSQGATSENARVFGKKAFELSSNNYRQVLQQSLRKIPASDKRGEILALYSRIQFVCDYVSGMTDSFAMNLHKQLTNA